MENKINKEELVATILDLIDEYVGIKDLEHAYMKDAKSKALVSDLVTIESDKKLIRYKLMRAIENLVSSIINRC